MYVCDICQKGLQHGNHIRHKHSGQWKLKAQRRKRTFKPNLQSFRAVMDQGGARRKLRVCTRCIKTGRVQRAV
ncbi:MAG: 50S ribosomal protein L28 [Fimbriimonadales bacterium]